MKITIESMSTDAAGSIINVRWSLSAERDGFKILDIGESKFKPNPAADGFTPFENLTESEVAGWVSKNINVQAVEKRLSNGAAAKMLITEHTSFPWDKQ